MEYCLFNIQSLWAKTYIPISLFNIKYIGWKSNDLVH